MKLLFIAGISLLSFVVFGAGIGVPPDGVMLNDADLVCVGRCVRDGDKYLFRINKFLKGTNSNKEVLLSTSFSKLVFDAERFYASLAGRESVLVTRQSFQTGAVALKPYWLQNSFWPQGHRILDERGEASLTKEYAASAIGLLSQENSTNVVDALLDFSSSDATVRILAVLAYLDSEKLETIVDSRIADRIRRASFQLIWLGPTGQNRSIRTGLRTGIDYLPTSLAIPFLLEEASQGGESERRSVMVQMKERLRRNRTIVTNGANMESEGTVQDLWEKRRLTIALQESELLVNDLADTDERVRKGAEMGLARVFRNEIREQSQSKVDNRDRFNLWKTRIEELRKNSRD